MFGHKEEVRINEQWKILSNCRDFQHLIQDTNPKVLDLFEMQIEEYLSMGEITESYLNKVPMSVCWYEGLIDTEMLLMEMRDYAFL